MPNLWDITTKLIDVQKKLCSSEKIIIEQNAKIKRKLNYLYVLAIFTIKFDIKLKLKSRSFKWWLQQLSQKDSQTVSSSKTKEKYKNKGL